MKKLESINLKQYWALLFLLFVQCSECQKCRLSRPYSPNFRDQPNGCIFRPNITIVTIVHGGIYDEFWYVVKDAALRAGIDLGIQSSFRTTENFDLQGMSNLIFEAIREKPDGLVISLPNSTFIGPAIQAAINSNIPVITINSGEDDFASLGALHHLGQPEDIAGYQGCLKLIQINTQIQTVLVLDVEGGMNQGVNLRSAGCIKAVLEHGSMNQTVSVLYVSKTLRLLTGQVQAKLRGLQNMGISGENIGVLAINTVGITATIAAAQNIGIDPASITMGTFDFSETFIPLMENGILDFAIDQQPYLQGYLPVLMLTAYVSTRNIFAPEYDEHGSQRALFTGPQFITVDRVQQKGCESSGVIYCDDPAVPTPFVPLMYSLRDTSANCPCIDRSQVNIGMVLAGGQVDPFWQVVQNGANQAAKDMRINLDLRATKTSDESQAIRVAQAVINGAPNGGVILSGMSPAYQSVMITAANLRVPVLSINGGMNTSLGLGAFMFVGQPDDTAGYQAAARMANTSIYPHNAYGKIKMILCLDSDLGTSDATNARCTAVNNWVVSNSPDDALANRISFDGSMQAVAVYQVEDYIRRLPSSYSLLGMIATKSDGCSVAQRVYRDLGGVTGSPPLPFYVGCFDTGAVQDSVMTEGTIQLIVDQQQWLQGYFPVVFLSLKILTGNYLAMQMVPTGPTFSVKKIMPYKNCENLASYSGTYIGWQFCPSIFSLPKVTEIFYQRISKGLAGSVYLFASLLLVLVLGTSGVFYFYKTTYLVKDMTFSYIYTLLASLVLLLISAILFVVEPTQVKGRIALCVFRPLILMIGIFGVLTSFSLYVQRDRLNSSVDKMKKAAKIYAGMWVIIILWFCKSLPGCEQALIHTETNIVGDELLTTTVYQNRCQIDMLFPWLLDLYTLVAIIIECFVIFTKLKLSGMHTYNYTVDSLKQEKWIMPCLYFLLLLGIFCTAVLAGIKSNPTGVATVISYGILITVGVLWGMLFATNLVILFKGAGDKVQEDRKGASLNAGGFTPVQDLLTMEDENDKNASSSGRNAMDSHPDLLSLDLDETKSVVHEDLLSLDQDTKTVEIC